MIAFENNEYIIKRKGTHEDVTETINELLDMIGHLPDDYPFNRIWLVTTLIADMMPKCKITSSPIKNLSQS